jgi:integral membrane protein (TIGR01906 family)
MKIFFAFCLIVFFVSTSALFAFGEVRLYNYGFTKYHISESTGIPEDKLKIISTEIIDYLVADSNVLDVKIDGKPLFNKKEIFHMSDVKSLLEKVKLSKGISLFFLMTFSILYLNPISLVKGKFIPNNLVSLIDCFRFASLVALLSTLIAGIVLAAAFRPLFYLFHNISFSNDYWQLDPRSDYLVMLFPEGFWIDTTLMLVAAVLLLAIGTFVSVSIMKLFVTRKLLISYQN